MRGLPPLPPLWLRRHVGPVRGFEAGIRAMAERLVALRLVHAGCRIVDLGCGCGGMIAVLLDTAGSEGSYLGVDVHGPSIRWCRRAWVGEDRVRFAIAAVHSPYSRRKGMRPADYRLPSADASVDFLLAKSLFTHLLPEETVAYLREIRRVLAPGGRALLTAFLFADSDVVTARGPLPAFPQGLSPGVRVRRRARPTAAVAYERELFAAWIAEAGLREEHFELGFWPGAARVPSGQDLLVLALAASRPAVDDGGTPCA